MTGLTNRTVVIDGRGHLLGRLASVVAKYLLQGGKVVVVRCEELNLSGHFYRNKIKFLSYLRKRCNVNPARGPFHFRAPSRIFYKAVRGMIPHKTKRGQAALARLRVFDGIPSPYDKRRRVVVPIALRVLTLRSDRKYCQVGRLSSEVGWHYQDVIKSLERKRKAKLRVTLKHNREMKKLTVKARENIAKAAEPFNKIIQSYGYEV
ncbi:large ribosomal subunit protein uL13 [Drosophila sulfurigaster albostrigata]|uniref:Large ribosomal subunit protein uL13 n=1 Tax=Drosophila albomicans TaxID=7291 RepID=A0A6P8WDS5_DROAB|nr:60S ribosomal protein L13a [Drosophila albomicans]XP_034115475.1 60S ribosomal protein L13a [Drosophila albomicans]XP_060645991.1 large ribosomal subunit protein uL13 [Drosophila nasuta]XP_062125321.1 large ribosomal subunit protein uL13 [Drosophila sulfurigaster albostrigata]